MFCARRGVDTSTTSQSDPAPPVPDAAAADDAVSLLTGEAPPDLATEPAGEAEPDDADEAAGPGGAQTGDAPGQPPEPPQVEGPEAEPAPPDRPRSPRWALALVAVGTVIVLLAAGTYTTALTLMHRYDRALPKASILDPSARAQAANGGHGSTLPRPLNFLLPRSAPRAHHPAHRHTPHPTNLPP